MFDETGVWAVEKYALDGGQLEDIPQERKNAFLLNFDSDLGVVAVGSCFSANNQDIESAICKSNPAAAFWECQCFAYEFKKSRMVWQPFDPGAEIPIVGDPEIEGSGAFEVLVEEFPSLGLGYLYNPMPMGVFDSDGTLSKYVLQQKAVNVWTEAEVAPDSLLECSVGCFGAQ
ncbi:hypothetical protein ACNOYE_06965 [Nannocystaceae bacterium ST9]